MLPIYLITFQEVFKIPKKTQTPVSEFFHNKISVDVIFLKLKSSMVISGRCIASFD